jgi:hypothetical protein
MMIGILLKKVSTVAVKIGSDSIRNDLVVNPLPKSDIQIDPEDQKRSLASKHH